MPAYRLHYFPESGNSYKLALMLTLCGQTFEPVWTDFGGGITRTAEWRRTVNEMGEIPVLGRMAVLPGWKSAYDLLPGKRLTHYAKENN